MPDRSKMKFATFIANKIATDAEEMTIVSKISTDSKDRDGEVLLPKGIDLKNYRKNPIVYWGHDYLSKPPAKNIWIKREGSDLIAKTKYAETEEGRELFYLYDNGFLNAFSVGFIPGQSHEPTEKELLKRPDWTGVSRIYDKWELLEYSMVGVPSNPQALQLAMSKGLKISDVLKKDLGLEPEEQGAGAAGGEEEGELERDCSHAMSDEDRYDAKMRQDALACLHISEADLELYIPEIGRREAGEPALTPAEERRLGCVGHLIKVGDDFPTEYPIMGGSRNGSMEPGYFEAQDDALDALKWTRPDYEMLVLWREAEELYIEDTGHKFVLEDDDEGEPLTEAEREQAQNVIFLVDEHDRTSAAARAQLAEKIIGVIDETEEPKAPVILEAPKAPSRPIVLTLPKRQPPKAPTVLGSEKEIKEALDEAASGKVRWIEQ